MSPATPIVSMPAAGPSILAGLHANRMSQTAPRVAGPHAHDFHMVTVFLSHPGLRDWGDRQTAATVGLPAAEDAIVWPAHDVWSAGWTGSGECVTVRIAVEFLQEVAHQLGQPQFGLRPAVIRRDRSVVQLALELASSRQQSFGGALYSKSLGTALAVRLLETAGAPASQRSPLPLDPLDLQATQNYVEAHLDQPLSVAQLAAVAGVSQWHFSRTFKAATGRTPHQFVIERRLARAAELLRTTDRPLAAVALDVGFASQSHLAAHFRRRFGVTPAQFARRTRTK